MSWMGANTVMFRVHFGRFICKYCGASLLKAGDHVWMCPKCGAVYGG